MIESDEQIEAAFEKRVAHLAAKVVADGGDDAKAHEVAIFTAALVLACATLGAKVETITQAVRDCPYWRPEFRDGLFERHGLHLEKTDG